MQWKTTGLLIMLALAVLTVPVKAEPAETVPLWPLYYSTVKPDGSSDVEVLFSAFSRQRSATGTVSGNMVPVFWGPNYFHVIPFYWHWNENYLIIPFGGKINDKHGVGLMFWGNNYCHVPPLYWSWNTNWLVVPLAWNIDGNKGVGPVWWGKDYFNVFPLYWQWQHNRLLFPLAWDFDGDKGIGPVLWGKNYFYVIPLVWMGTIGDNLVGPVAWGENYFDILPLYWHWDNNYLLLPLAWNVNGNKGIGPVWWGQDYFHVFPLYWQWNDKKMLFPLLYNQSDAQGTDWRFLWRLIRYQHQGDETNVEFQPLFMYSKGSATRNFSIMWRLFEYNRDNNGRTLRLFFSPKIKLSK